MDFGQLTPWPRPARSRRWSPRISAPVMPWLAIGVLAGFAVKVPLMPFHTWLPAAYAEAPSPVTMLLTGAMSKMGVYGLLRIAMPIFGPQIAAMRTPLLVLAVATVVMGAWAAAAQKDLKRVFAYSSVNHLGYCLLGIFALAVPASGAAQQASQAAALNGVILQMFNHGITAAALFWFIAMIQFRTGGLRGIDDFGGLRKPAPVFAGLMGIALFSSLGLPGLNGFVGEFLIFRGVFPLAWVAATVSVLGLLVTAVVILTVIQKVFTGPVPERWAAFPDLHHSERHGSRARHRTHVPARPCAPADCGHHQPHGPEPAGALEILENGLDHLHLVCRRADRGAAAQGQARPCALVRARRRRGRPRPSPSRATPRAWGRARQVFVDVLWVPSMGIHFLLAADGISRVLVLLTGIASVAGVLFSWNIDLRTNQFFAFYLALIGGVYGVFLSGDLFLLFVFYEIAIVPKYFLIAIWGSTRREYGAMKLALYSFVGSAMVLIGLLAAYVTAGQPLHRARAILRTRACPSASRCGASRWSSSASRFSPACGRSTPGRPPATSPRPPPPPCCSPAW